MKLHLREARAPARAKAGMISNVSQRLEVTQHDAAEHTHLLVYLTATDAKPMLVQLTTIHKHCYNLRTCTHLHVPPAPLPAAAVPQRGAA